jgi:RIO-like serine/threonine protein kinase
MVVMEYIDGDTLASQSENERGNNEKGASEVWRALELLHNVVWCLVISVLPNIMITKDGKVKLIDFNWAGEGRPS